MAEAPRGSRKTVVGMVVSGRMQKTVVVAIERSYRHPDYDKLVRRRTKVKAHDEQNACKVGDRVLLAETRPLSRDKRWRVVEIVQKAV
ncbi:MAG: 30S ribosomal protein S17 [candidate division NC10 bacterium]|nr:30S ribosomal protein S17 [candidate division NC10 bacterium]